MNTTILASCMRKPQHQQQQTRARWYTGISQTSLKYTVRKLLFRLVDTFQMH